jgi:hypothetical protein
VHAATYGQIPHHLPSDRIVDHLIDADLVGPRAALEEEIVQQVELEVAARENVRARPWRAHESIGSACWPLAMK